MRGIPICANNHTKSNTRAPTPTDTLVRPQPRVALGGGGWGGGQEAQPATSPGHFISPSSPPPHLAPPFSLRCS